MNAVGRARTFQPFAGARSRPRGRPGTIAVAGSILLHAALVAAAGVGALQARRHAEPDYTVYRVRIYSPPPQVAGEPADAVPKPAIIKQPTPTSPEVKPEPAKKTAATKATAAEAAKKPKAEPVAGRNPKPGPVGGEGLNVLQEGEDFPDPVYLENIIRQLNRYFRWTGEANLEAQVGFQIQRDGRVTGIRVLKRSGSRDFDIAAVEAVEEANKRNVFGPLPRVWPHNVLPVAFSFLPPR